jgi:hypothetical protein
MKELCAQCKSNADWNEAGGYKELAERCRQYCRNGHIENAPTAAEAASIVQETLRDRKLRDSAKIEGIKFGLEHAGDDCRNEILRLQGK